MFEFLNNIELVQKEEVKVDRTSRKQELNPSNGADLRLFKDGRIYPSEELIEEYNLNYVAKGEAVGNGFDVFSTKSWEFYPKDAPQHAVLIASVSKALPKVDVFSTTRFNPDLSPISNVKDQGAPTFGKQLIDTLRDTYNLPMDERVGIDTLFNDSNYVDLKIDRNNSLKTKDGIYHIPKQVTKGINAGTVEHIRRENLNLHPLVVYTATMEEAYKLETQSSVQPEENVTASDIVS